MTRAELASGKTSASARTALSWNLGLLADTPGVCAHLTVLDYGYAYAEQRACEGGDLVSSVEGWLEQVEMAQFDAWLYGYSPLYVGENYLNGAGATSMTDEEAAAVATWAQALWTRLSGLPLAPADAAGV
jgi:uroporphyrinogen-III decarboxylase